MVNVFLVRVYAMESGTALMELMKPIVVVTNLIEKVLLFNLLVLISNFFI